MKPKFTLVETLDTTNGECERVQIAVADSVLTARVRYWREAARYTREFRFDFVNTYGFYDEMTMPMSFTECSDRLCEVTGSLWLKRYHERISPVHRLHINHHYAIYFSDCGYLEVLCRTVEISAEKVVDEQE